MLLILDDVTDFAAQVQGVPVVGDRFRVLFTSRERWLNPESRLDLGVLEPTAALTLLSNFVGEDRIAAEQATAEVLCEWLGYLPSIAPGGGRTAVRPYRISPYWREKTNL